MLRKILFVLCSLLLVAADGFAHNQTLCSHAHGKQPTPMFYDLPKRPYDVLKYDLYVDLREAFMLQQHVYWGTNVITLQLTEDTDRIDLDAGDMIISNVLVNGDFVVYNQDRPEILEVVFSSQLKTGTTVLIQVEYGVERSETENIGSHFYKKGTYVGRGPLPAQDSIFNAEDVFYTMSEPVSAHFWMPCNDQPQDKAEATISVTALNNVTVASNGYLDSIVAAGELNKRWYFRSDRPITTYLMVITASRYKQWQERVPRFHNPTDSIDLVYYAWQEDYDQTAIIDGSKYNAQRTFEPTKDMMRRLEELFGPYPFVKYGQAAVHPFNFGGMEHQTMTTINRSWFRGYQDGIMHELGHQWFGDNVTCETFKDLWLNEGFATYTEILWWETWGGDEWYVNGAKSKAHSYFEGDSNHYAIYDPPTHLLFNGATTYAKAACVIHMLRRMLRNDSLFFSTLEQYQKDFADDNCNTQQFRDYLSLKLGIDLTEYFDQWIYGALHPVYDIRWAQNTSNTIYLRVNQLQTVRDHFTMPLQFRAYHSGGVDTIRFVNDSRSQSYYTAFEHRLDSLVFDDDAVVLSQHILRHDPAVSVSRDEMQEGFTAYVRGEEVICSFDNDTPKDIQVHNILGELVMTHQTTGARITRINTTQLSNGAYFLRWGKESAKVVLLR